MKQRRISVSYTLLLWVGAATIIAGVVVAIVGVGAPSQFEGEVAGAKFKTTQLGLAILAIGAAFTATVAAKLPKDVQPFSGGVRWRVRLLDRLPAILLVIVAVALTLLVFSVLRN